MKREKFTSPFPPLVIHGPDIDRLNELSQMFTDQHRQLYEHYVTVDHEMVDTQSWNFQTKKDELHIFVEKRDPRLGPMGKFFPSLLAVGTIPGALDDVMSGVMNPTVEAMRIHSAYLKDQMVDCAVLATLLEPSAADPFRALTIKWMEISHQSLMVRSVVKNRDFVYMESTGMSQFSNGQRFGYQLMHSVQFPHTPELDANWRGNLSHCALYRQRSNNIVDVFIKVVLSPEDDIMLPVRLKATTSDLLATTKLAAFGQKRKMLWFAQRKNPAKARVSMTPEGMCCSCQRRVSSSVLGGLRNNTCRVCGGSICSSCKVKKKLSSVAPDGQLWQHSIVFCNVCLSEATNANAEDIVKEQTGWIGSPYSLSI